MKYNILHLALIFTLIASPITAHAQGSTPQIIHSTKPIAPELKDALDAWLAVDPPSDAIAYVVTYAKTRANGETQVSLAGVNVAELDAEWSLFESIDTVVWIGSVAVAEDGAVTPFTNPQARGAGGHLAIPALPAAGGGSYVAFPFATGTGMIYGPRGVHGSGDYGTSGMVAVDLVSGDDLGAAAAPPYAYASDAGTIDYICDDDTTVAVRTHNTTTGDYFIYAHLLDNAGLAIDEDFDRGQQLGSIKYGNFDDDCGWAQQQEDHYHIHWMFTPANGAFQAEGCILGISSQKWTCGNDTIGTGGWLYGGGGYGSGLDDLTGGAGGTAEPNFWTYLIAGFITLADRGILKLLPEHSLLPFVNTIVYTVSLMLRVTYVLTYSNINVGPLMAVISYGIAWSTFFSILWIASFALKVIKLIPMA